LEPLFVSAFSLSRKRREPGVHSCDVAVIDKELDIDSRLSRLLHCDPMRLA
jgi:hypothetical protein